jgi:hypothetical protein
MRPSTFIPFCFREGRRLVTRNAQHYYHKGRWYWKHPLTLAHDAFPILLDRTIFAGKCSPHPVINILSWIVPSTIFTDFLFTIIERPISKLDALRNGLGRAFRYFW